MNSKVYKWCVVPLCKNTSIATPKKLFVYVPNKKIMRDEWLKLARRDPTDVVTNSAIYFCEDHFDLPNDMENYMQYHLMGSVSQVRMKPGCIPKKFSCQTDIETGLSKSIERKCTRKKRKMIVLEECEKQFEESRLVTKNCDAKEIKTGSSVQHISEGSNNPFETSSDSDYKGQPDAVHLINSNEHSCRYCNFIAKDFEGVKHHIQTNHKKLVVSGKINSENQPQIESLVDVKNKEPEKESCKSKDKKINFFQCEYCDYNTHRLHSLKLHRNSRHTRDTLYNCEYCDYEGTSRNSLRGHINSNHKKKVFHKCQYCEYEATEMTNLRGHINSKHTRTILYKCELCKFETTWSESLRRHIKLVHVEKSFKCDICDYVAKNVGTWKRHMKAKHKTKISEESLDVHKTQKEILQEDELVEVEPNLVKCEEEDQIFEELEEREKILQADDLIKVEPEIVECEEFQQIIDEIKVENEVLQVGNNFIQRETDCVKFEDMDSF